MTYPRKIRLLSKIIGNNKRTHPQCIGALVERKMAPRSLHLYLRCLKQHMKVGRKMEESKLVQ